MKISYNWLKQYTGLETDPEELSLMLTNCGLEVEAMEHIGIDKTRLEGVVVGHVVEKIKHPNADKLSLTKVDIGKGNLLSIVCGAPNVDQGQKVLVATIGTKMKTPKGEFVIQTTKLRGELSEGMICAEDELGLGDSHAGIMILDENAPIGTPAKDYFNVDEDYTYEIGLTPNRSDATSHIGVARDVLAVLNCKNKSEIKLRIPDVSSFKTDNHQLPIDVIIEDPKACPRYTGLTISGVQVKDSPAWLQEKLKVIGLRPINNIVDITNYVLFETGQPLHAFDAGQIKGDKVIIKKLASGTKFKTLDGVERELSSDDLMICNSEEGMCIAGVFGGEKSGVTSQTKNIFLESAYFNPVSIRKTSKYHGLKTDASFRFERGADPNITVHAIKRAALLIKEIAGGAISSEIADVYPEKIENRVFDFSLDKLNIIAGKTIEKDLVLNILNSLEIEIINNQDRKLVLSVPPFKTDVTREIDVMEEILRVYGYNNIECSETLHASLSYSQKPDGEKLQNIISDYLTANGFYEIMTNSLTSQDYYEKNSNLFDPGLLVHLVNPLSKELNVMRQTLLFSGLESVEFNKNHKNPDTFFYEFGKVYQCIQTGSENPLDKYKEHKQLAIFASGNIVNPNWHGKEQAADLYFIKAFAVNVMQRLGVDTKSLKIAENSTPELYTAQLTYYHDKTRLCDLGQISPAILKQFDIKDDVYFAVLNWDYLVYGIEKQTVKYREVSRFPEVRRDLALLIERSVKYSEIERIAYETEPKLMKKVELFDIYEGENIGKNKKSYAVSFILQDEEKTLTDKQIDETMNKLIEAYKNKLDATLR
ncbi:MAG TPA: phenylalanine--tRNA ligase subunit beta [Bacteroidales bacterium]|nr:phenylalanine--tRNA ligase subunit beta [Bacteroidales bacterium]